MVIFGKAFSAVSSFAFFSMRLQRLQAAARLSRTWGDCYGYLLVATGRAELMNAVHEGGLLFTPRVLGRGQKAHDLVVAAR